MKRALTGLAATVGLVLLSACAGDSTEFAGSRLDEPYRVPGVVLTDTTGAPYSLTEDTDRPLTLVFFGYTHCPDLCPLVMSNLSAALNRLDDEQRDEVDLVFVTTDPERDDEAALRDYLDGYGEEIVGLTGRLDSIIELGEPMHVYVNDGKKLPSGGYDLGGHTTAVLGIDAGDEAVVVWSDDTSATEFANDIETLLEES